MLGYDSYGRDKLEDMLDKERKNVKTLEKKIKEKDAKILALDAEVFKEKHHAKLFFDERNYAETQLHQCLRALWIARANRAIEKIAWFKLWNSNISAMNPEDSARQEYDKWKKNLGKFLKKAEEYR